MSDDLRTRIMAALRLAHRTEDYPCTVGCAGEVCGCDDCLAVDADAIIRELEMREDRVGNLLRHVTGWKTVPVVPTTPSYCLRCGVPHTVTEGCGRQ
jgi:hypothetical protein